MTEKDPERQNPLLPRGMREGIVADQKDDDIAARLQARAEQVTPLERGRMVPGGTGETAWVRRLFDQINAFVLKGMTFQEIAAVLNEEGVQLTCLGKSPPV